jgi:hypothetical protein
MNDDEQHRLGGPRDADDSGWGEFDERAVRRATRRGILRTTGNAVAFLLLGLFALEIATGLVLTAGDREDRLTHVVMPGLLVAHPEYESHSRGCCNRSFKHLTADLEIQPRSPVPLPPTFNLEPTQDLWGRYDPYSASVPDSALGQLVQNYNTSEDQVRQVLERLPEGMSSNAVVLFRRPLDQAGVDSVLATLDFPRFGAAVVFDVPRSARWVGSPVGTKRRIGWPEASIRAFDAWADSLSTSDDETLHLLGLPRAEDIKEMSRGGAAGIVIASVGVDRLLELLDDPEVRTVLPGEVAHDLVFEGV